MCDQLQPQASQDKLLVLRFRLSPHEYVVTLKTGMRAAVHTQKFDSSPRLGSRGGQTQRRILKSNIHRTWSSAHSPIECKKTLRTVRDAKQSPSQIPTLLEQLLDSPSVSWGMTMRKEKAHPFPLAFEVAHSTATPPIVHTGKQAPVLQGAQSDHSCRDTIARWWSRDLCVVELLPPSIMSVHLRRDHTLRDLLVEGDW